MEGLQYQFGRSSYGAGPNPHDVNVRSMNNNNNNNKNLWAGRSRNSPSLYSNYEMSRERGVTKSKHTWWWNDPERKRKRRVAKYKLYAAEGKFKHSVKKGWRWLKIKFIKIGTNF